MKRFITFFSAVSFFLFSFAPVFADQITIRILHMNDFHGFAEQYKPFGSDKFLGGIAYLSKRSNQLRGDRPTLLLSAGDMIQGNNWANFSQGESSIAVMNSMKFDAMVVGNHELDFGQDVLKKRISESEFPVLGANIEGIDLLNPYIIKEIFSLRIGIIGIVTDDTPVTTHPRNISGLTFIPAEEAVRKYVAELRDKTDFIIVLSHIGLAADRQLAENVKGIDVIVGGHSHTKVLKPVLVGNTIILQAWEHAKALGVLDLTFENGKIVNFDGHLEIIQPLVSNEDKDVLEIVGKYGKKVDAVLDETMGVAELDLDGENVRRRETNLGDFIADIMRDASGADIAIINGGGLRTSIKKGEVKVKHVYAVLPFDNYIVAIRLTGKQIRDTLEYGISAIDEGAGRFPQVSGLTFSYNPHEKIGSRIREILIGGSPLVETKEYVVATNDFLAAGGDGYKAFGDAVRSSKDYSNEGGAMKGEKLVYSDSGRWLRDVVIDVIKAKRNFAPTVEGRIVEVPQ